MFIRISDMNYLKKFFYPQPKQTCMNCDKEKNKLITVRVHCDLEHVENVERVNIKSLSICKKCVIDFAQKNVMMTSLYFFTRNCVFKLLNYTDLSQEEKSSLKEMRDILRKENEFRMKISL